MKKNLLFFFLLLSLGGYCQCTLTVKISSTNPVICSGTSSVLTATASAGTAPYTYAWNTGETTPTITVNKATTYTVTVSDKTPGCQPVKQTITITASVTPNAPTAQNVIVCQNSSATLTATAPGGTYQWYDAATGGNFLGSGDAFITPPISATTIFYVQTTVAGCTSTRTPVTVSLLTKPVGTGGTICKGNQITLSATNGDSFTWYDAPGGNVLGTGATFTTPPLQATTTFYVVGVTGTCTSAATPVLATVTPPPQQPTAATVSICSGNAANLHAVAPAGIFDWFTTPTGGTSLISSPDYTTPLLTATTTYYVQTSLNGCESPRTAVTVIVNSIPPLPTVPATVTTCYGTSAAITATAPGGTYNWYDAATGGNLLGSGNTFNTPPVFSTTVFYVSVTSGGGCTSTRTPVTVNISPQVPVPTVTAPLVCTGTATTLTATGPGGTYQWYDAATAGNLLATGASYTTPVLSANATYYVQTTIGGCTSARTPVAVTILPPVTPPTAFNTSVCSGNFTVLTATGGAGNYLWFDAPTGGNLLSSGQAFVTPTLTATTTYYVESMSVNGCESTRSPATVTVNPIPSAPSGTGATVCAGSTATLTASASGGTFQWYDAATGGNLLASGSSFTTPVLSATTIYYVQNIQLTCPGPRTAVTATVTPTPTQFIYPSGTICTSGGNVTPALNNPAGGTFSASPTGIVFVSTTTGQINVAASTPGDYIISYAGNGVCPHVTTARVSIVTTPNAQFSYSGPFCQSGANQNPVFPAGASPGVFSATPAGLTFVSTSTGEIDPGASTPNTYTVTNTIAANGGCSASVMTATVTINRSVTVNAGPNQIIQSGNTVQLAGSITGGITTGQWSGGTGTFSDPTLLNAVYTPGAGETSVTLTLTSNDPPGPCGVGSDKVTITINPIPVAPTAAGQSVCPGTSAALSATAPGGAYKWFDALTGGAQLAAGPTFNTPPLTVNTTYYVQTTIGGFTSTRTPVTVTINAVPPAPLAGPQSACAGNPTTLTATGSAGTYAWYDAPVSGNLLSTSATYLTPSLYSPVSYYVEAVVNGCISPRTKVDVSINPVPTIISASTASVCSGNGLNYTIGADIVTATFTWSRAAVPGISNAAVANQTSSTITEALINKGATPVNVIYVIIPSAGGCPGTPFNYTVTVFPPPVVTSAPQVPVCSGVSPEYDVTFSSPVSAFSWSRAAVPGISNLPVSGQTATTIREVLFNTTNAPIDVTYVFNYSTPDCTGLLFNFTVTVNPVVKITSLASNPSACSGTAEGYVITSNIPSATFSWSRVAVTGISNPAVTGQTSGTIDETLINTTTHAIRVNYIITATANGCPGAPFAYGVTVNPQPATPVANSNSPVCINSTIQLKTPTVLGATYLWTGPNGFSSPLQNPNVPASAAAAGTYNLFVLLKGCSSVAAPVIVVVDDFPKSVAGPNQSVCHNVTSVQLAGAETGGTPTGIWTTAGTGTFSPSPIQLDAVYIPSAADKAAVAVKLTLTSTSKDDCNISFDSMTITFTAVKVNSAPTGITCNGTAQNYQITSATPSVTFTYDRPAVAGISNPAVSSVAADVIDETLINNGATPIDVKYIITPTDAGGCPGIPFTYTVTVNSTPATPVINVNTPVCVQGTIHLTTPSIAGATYSWTGPNGFSSPLQNPDVPASAASAGVYNLVITVNTCSSATATSIPVVVNPKPISYAGPDQNVCTTTTAVQLAGTETGGTPAGIWSTSGTGTFSPSNTDLNAQYIPSAQDKASNGVVLTLTSTSNDDCTPSPSSMNLTFRPAPGVDAGPDQEVCSQDASVQLAGKILIAGGALWSTSGTGAFSPAATQQDAIYLPSAQDISNGSVTLTLLATGAGPCNISNDQLVIKFIPPPTVDAGGTVFVLHGKTITLKPTVSDNNVTYLWTPNVDIDNNTAKNPVITGDVDITYTLTVTDSRGCVSTDQVMVKVSPEVVIPNTFTPNNDGINDIWNIQGLIAYTRATVDVFDRYGQKVFHSVGYPQAWDGTYGGKFLPTGTYYYIIDTKFNNQVLSGAVTIVR